MIKDTDSKEASKSFKAKRFLRNYDRQEWTFSRLMKMACFFFSIYVFFPGVVKGWVGCSDGVPPYSEAIAIESSSARYSVIDGIHVLQLEGSHYEMGLAYGRVLSSPLRETLRVIKAHFINDFGLSMRLCIEKHFSFTKGTPLLMNLF